MPKGTHQLLIEERLAEKRSYSTDYPQIVFWVLALSATPQTH